MAAVYKTGDFNLKRVFNYHIERGRTASKEREKGIRIKGDLHIFHTIEFLIMVYLLSFLWYPFIFVFIGMVFHSLLDAGYLINKDYLYRRELFLINWIRRKLSKKK